MSEPVVAMSEPPPEDVPVSAARPIEKPLSPPFRLLRTFLLLQQTGRLSSADLALLRRLDPARPDRRHIQPLLRLLVESDLGDVPPTDARYQRLALMAHLLAVVRGHHAEGRPAGEGLFAMGISQQRLVALLAADFPSLLDLLPRIARRAAASGTPLDWRPLLILAWTADRDEAEADNQRARIAASFLRAEHKASAPAHA